MDLPKENIKTTHAHKIAAIFLIINVSFIIIGIMLGIEDDSKISMLLTSSIFDLLIGFSILMNKQKWLTLIKVRIILGLIIFGFISLIGKDYWTLGIQIVLSTSLLLLLLGEAGKVRKIISITLFSIISLIYVEGTLISYNGSSLFSTMRLSTQYNLIDIDKNELFILPELSREWKMRSKDSYSDENPYVDLWLVNPSNDSHIMIIYENLPASQKIDHLNVITNVKNNASAGGEMEILSENTDVYLDFDRTLLQTLLTIDDTLFKYYYSILSNSNEVTQIICFSYENNFGSAFNDFEAFIDGIKFR